MPRALGKILKWVGIVLGGLVAVIVVLVVGLVLVGGSRVNRTYEVEAATIVVPSDESFIERGKHLVESIGLCQECHGENLGGDLLEDDPLFGRFAPPNLTTGAGGVGGTLTDEDFVRAIRHGVDREGKSLLIMPSDFYFKLSDKDVGAIIAYVRSVPPVDNELPESGLGPLGKIFVLFGAELLPSSLIDHSAPRPAAPADGVSKEYGEYLAVVCALCHAEDFAGRELPGGDPDAPRGPNITPAGSIGQWSEAEFIQTIRTGVTPTGKSLDEEFMPWDRFAKMTDDELMALWLFLESLPPVSLVETE